MQEIKGNPQVYTTQEGTKNWIHTILYQETALCLDSFFWLKVEASTINLYNYYPLLVPECLCQARLFLTDIIEISSVVSNGFLHWLITSMTFSTSSSSNLLQTEPDSLWHFISSRGCEGAISLHRSTKLALACAVNIHRFTAPFLRLNPFMPPFGISLFNGLVNWKLREAMGGCALYTNVSLRQHTVSVGVRIWKF